MRQRVRDAAWHSRGFILMAFYLFLVVLLTQAGAVLAQTTWQMRYAQRAHDEIQAQYQAEGALDRALVTLRGAANPRGVPAWPAGGQTLRSSEYEIAPDPQGRPNIYRIRATGYYPSRDLNQPAAPFEDKRLELYTRVVPGQRPPPGLVGDRGVTLSGSVRVDSYDSARGGIPRSTGRGLIGSNGTGAGTITISGSVDVFGDVLAGPGAPRNAISITGSSRVSGRIGAATEAYNVTPVSEAAGTEDLSLSGNRTLTLPGGTYRYKQLSISGRARLIFTGPATVYAETVSLSGNSIATAYSLPTNLTIKVPGNGGVSLSGTTGFYGLIYAPTSQVSLSGNSTLYGAVLGKAIRLSGSVNFWYDEALSGSGGGGNSNQVNVLSWGEGA